MWAQRLVPGKVFCSSPGAWNLTAFLWESGKGNGAILSCTANTVLYPSHFQELEIPWQSQNFRLTMEKIYLASPFLKLPSWNSPCLNLQSFKFLVKLSGWEFPKGQWNGDTWISLKISHHADSSALVPGSLLWNMQKKGGSWLYTLSKAGVICTWSTLKIRIF